MKKLISLLLILALLASLGVVPASAEDDSYAGKTVLIATGNFRGQIDYYACVKYIKDSYQAKGAEVILVDAGNYLQGSAWSDACMGEAVYDLMNAVGYQAAAMGRAEFSYTAATTGYVYHGNYTRYYTQAMLQNGTEEITYAVNSSGSQTATLPARAGAGFTALCSHLTVLPHTNPDGSIWYPYSFADYWEYTTPSGLSFRFRDGDQNRFADQVQDGFLAWKAEEPTQSPNQVDYEVELMTELDTPAPKAENYGKQMIIRPAQNIDTLALAFVFDNASKQFLGTENLRFTAEEQDETIVNQIANVKANVFNSGELAFGKSEVLLEGRDSVSRNAETNLGDLVTDALAWYAPRYVDGMDLSLPTVAIINGGNLDDFLYPGALTARNLLRALPFSPMGIGVIQITGSQLLEMLEAGCQTENCPGFVQVSGMRYTVDLSQPYDAGEAYGSFYKAASIHRVSIDEVDGAPFDPDAVYNVIADNYLMSGKDTYYTLKEARDAGAFYINNGSGAKVRDIVKLYIENVLTDKTVGAEYAKPQGRIRVNRFVDVERGKFYFEPILWAVSQDPPVTSGKDATHFGPKDTCTRGQVVTFLWNAMGQPKPTITDCPFVDVKEGKYYYEAMLWALETGVTSGKDDAHFAPNETCTRGQVVTFLWNAMGKPEPTLTDCPFVDVKPGKYYYNAMLWALETGVTSGLDDTHFGPNETCTRGQVVTFLYNALS
jgi:5''-nucleotidase/2'',3''-cyclic phosphodiesterase and related esterases